jgi:hypothetical protein
MNTQGPPRRGLRGHTFLELLAVLALLALALSSGIPLARGLADRMAVVGAREALAGLFHRARLEAITHGGSRVRLLRSPPSADLLVGGFVVERVELRDVYRARLRLSRDRAEADIPYNAMGLGRVASQTLRIERGEAEAKLVVSSYGRVRRE